MIDYNDIKQTIAENLPDNNRREITAARLRDTLDGFVDKVQETEAGLEGKVSANETNIGNLSGRVDTNEANVTNLTGRVDTNEANVTNLTGRVDSLSGEVSGLSGTVGNLSGEVNGLSGRVDELSGSIGNVPRIVDNPIKGGANDVASTKWDTTIAAIAGLYTAESPIGGNSLKINKVSVIDGSYVKFDGTIVQLGGYSYFEYTLLKKNGYITIPAQEYGAIAASDGGAMGFAFYDKDGNVISYNSDIIDWQFSGQLELKVPYGATKIRASLINGTFDPDNLYVIESTQPNNCNQLRGVRGEIKECMPVVDYLAKIGVDGKPAIEGRSMISVIKLLEGDELEAEVGSNIGALLSIGDSYDIEGAKTVIYQGVNFVDKGWIYYKANKDCYAFVAKWLNPGAGFKVIHNNRMDGDLQYQLAALIKRIKPLRGGVATDAAGRGIQVPSGNFNRILFKLPVLANTILSYTLHSDVTLVHANTAYWYSGQPTASVDVNTNFNFSNGNEIDVNNSGSNNTGYVLVEFQCNEEIPEDVFNSIYLEKVN